MNHVDKIVDVTKLENILEMIKEHHSDAFISGEIIGKELTVYSRKRYLLKFLRFLRDEQELQFKVMVDLCGVDYPEKEKRFEVVYHLLSVAHNIRLRVKVMVADGNTVPSITPVYSAANWYEREAYDMFGIVFEEHPDMRRLLTDYGFEGFPLRKDFPLEGHVEVYYDEKEKRVAYKPVDLPQEFRHFDAVSQWKGMTGNIALSEDESTFDKSEFADQEESAS